MLDFFRNLLGDATPWLEPILAWALALFIAYCFWTLPSYFLLWPFFRRLRVQLFGFADRLPVRAQRASDLRRERLDRDADEHLTGDCIDWAPITSGRPPSSGCGRSWGACADRFGGSGHVLAGSGPAWRRSESK